MRSLRRFFDYAKAVRYAPRINFELFEHVPDVLVAGEHEKLMTLPCKVAEHGAGIQVQIPDRFLRRDIPWQTTSATWRRAGRSIGGRS